MKCAICGAAVGETFLKKPLGTTVKREGKPHIVCFECQRRFPTKGEQLANVR